MGNDVSSQATMMAAKSKMSSALTSVEEQLSLKNKTEARTAPKTRQKDWDKVHEETDEVYQQKQIRSKERVSSVKERWEASRKRNEQRASQKDVVKTDNSNWWK